jgi:hypothetical protein
LWVWRGEDKDTGLGKEHTDQRTYLKVLVHEKGLGHWRWVGQPRGLDEDMVELAGFALEQVRQDADKVPTDRAADAYWGGGGREGGRGGEEGGVKRGNELVLLCHQVRWAGSNSQEPWSSLTPSPGGREGGREEGMEGGRRGGRKGESVGVVVLQGAMVGEGRMSEREAGV